MIHLTEKPVELAVRAHAVFVAARRERAGPVRRQRLDVDRGGADRPPAFLMELDPLYCDVIVERWQNFTGRRPSAHAHGPPGRRRLA